MSVLEHASHQWSKRPADQRFSSLDELHTATTRYREQSREAPNVDIRSLRIGVGAGGAAGTVRLLAPGMALHGDETPEPVLVSGSGNAARFTHHSFTHFARRIGAPSAYLRDLPPELVAANMNHGIMKADRPEDAESLLFAENGGLRLRAMLTNTYQRIWNDDVTRRLKELVQRAPEWQPAPEAFDGSRGLYASDHDMFVFMVDNKRRIFEKDPNGGLGRGFFCWNSEVGAASFGIMTFYYEYCCGNHRVWGAKGVAELRIPHVGNADTRAFSRMQVELRRYAESSAKEDEARIERMQTAELGKTKEDVIDRVFGLRITDLTRAVAVQAYDLAEKRTDWYGSPRTVWGFTGGLTEIARDLPNADARVALDRAAGKVMQIAF